MADSKKNLNVVVGLGKTGLSCIKFCLRENIPVAVIDSRKEPPCADELKTLCPDIKKVFGEFSSELIQQALRLIVSPGISLQEPAIKQAIKNGIAIVGDIELFAQKVSAPIVAITGSNAKSTVTALVGEMAKKTKMNVKVGGNLGTPALNFLERKEGDLYVLELSSFQLETTNSLKAAVATILNISEDHMDRYNNMEEYIVAKQRIYLNCQQAVVNRADKNTWPKNNVTKIVSFGLDKPEKDQFGLIKSWRGTYLVKGEEKLLNINKIKIPGSHNLENILAALALGEAVSLDMSAMLQAVIEFSGLPHRCQYVGERDGVRWYNDSKGTNVGATFAAIKGLAADNKGKIILIAGGIGKGADFTPLCEPIKKSVRKIILMGEAAKNMATIFKDCGEIEIVNSMKAAVEKADLAALRGDKVLLSPACASFDMFNNFEHRGDEFIKYVKQL